MSPVPGGRRAPYPGFVAPCLASLHARAPAGDRWVHEIKHDGYRVQIHIRRGGAQAYTRRGYEWSGRFQSLVEAAAALPARQAILDGEAVVPGRNGIADFAALQEALASGRSDRMLYYVFDLLYLDGLDLRGATLIDRKQALRSLLERGRRNELLYSEHLEAEGDTMW